MNLFGTSMLIFRKKWKKNRICLVTTPERYYLPPWKFYQSYVPSIAFKRIRIFGNRTHTFRENNFIVQMLHEKVEKNEIYRWEEVGMWANPPTTKNSFIGPQCIQKSMCCSACIFTSGLCMCGIYSLFSLFHNSTSNRTLLWRGKKLCSVMPSYWPTLIALLFTIEFRCKLKQMIEEFDLCNDI